jgi:hypothetical protein
MSELVLVTLAAKLAPAWGAHRHPASLSRIWKFGKKEGLTALALSIARAFAILWPPNVMTFTPVAITEIAITS